VIKKAEEKV